MAINEPYVVSSPVTQPNSAQPSAHRHLPALPMLVAHRGAASGRAGNGERKALERADLSVRLGQISKFIYIYIDINLDAGHSHWFAMDSMKIIF